MSKSVELLSGSEDGEQGQEEDRSHLNLNGNRQLSRSATELRVNNEELSTGRASSAQPSQHRHSHVQQHHHHHRHVASVAQRTQTFFATLKNRWARARSKERKKAKDAHDSTHSVGVESDYAADYSSEHSKSSSTTHSPAKIALNHPESPLARGKSSLEDSPGRCSDNSSKLSARASREAQDPQDPMSGSSSAVPSTYESSQSNELARRRELALRQHAFFQLRMHIRRGANLVAMDRCGASDPYVKIKCCGRLLHKSRTVFDYDWGLQDDFMGAAPLDLTQFDLGQPHDITLKLKDPARPQVHLGEIFLTVTLWPRNQQEKEQNQLGNNNDKKECDDKVSHEHFFTSDAMSDDIERDEKKEEVSLRNIDDKSKLEEEEEEEEEEEKNGNEEEDKKLTRRKNVGKRRYGLNMDEVQRHKKSVQAFKQSLEKRVESIMEKIIEDRVERILEEKADKHPWLQPIETWIVDKCKKDVKKDRLPLISKESEGKEDSKGKKGELDVEFKNSGEHEEFIKIISTPVPVIEIHDKHSGENKHTPDFIDRLKEGWKEKVEDVTRPKVYYLWTSTAFRILTLGTEKYKSKVVNKTVNPVWLEQFDLHLYEDPYLGQELEVTVWDRDKGHQDDLMGRTTIDLAGLERETTHRIWKELEDGAGSIFLLLTISGTTASETISDLAAHEETPQERGRVEDRYSLWNSLQRPRDVGHLTVKVYRAQGLAAADLGGKSDPFCVLELVNSRLQTQTEYKTLAPNWQKIFTFNVKDINSVLEVTVYDEDRDHKVEFLGKIAIPLLKIRNGEKRWSCWEWESKMRSIVALVLFVLGCYYFEPYMIPVAALLIMLKYCCEEKKSLKERLQAIQEVTQTVQNSIGYIASLCERVKNLFNFTVPYLSYLAMILTVLGSIVLYLVPIRYLILAWGVNKFFRKLLRPHSIPNNEILDLISRLPDDEDLLNYRELKPMPTADCEKASTSSPSSNATSRREQRKRHNKAA
ncbi:Similar to Mctp: Multiple C2 and transmembrane domain-containing protein (Drosophila melanogaster) [Cotesia congregata]|uniref:Similar to Mctp: Multiple C2 and transmembrane domain-containing protein (Drosophila melanogaster) n=1 Tax=Cotesia congregata TaxID=51543 RepID=A0A8J2HA85_COTCN|nr:Similar to Mctp: Multiple C2 and transmembrane domain-containing protein (Drosophila melanogaster) [Cotesia congregata]